MSEPERLEPGVLRLIAPNPSPMTERGTNTYLVGHTALTVIDPGPDDPAHLEAILAAAAGLPIRRILVTHAHRDHSPLARPLARRTGAPVLAFGDAEAGRSSIMAELGEVGGGEGVDPAFRPDARLADGATIAAPDGVIEALWTPGHFGNHMTFLHAGAAFCGDLVMGWASSLVSPPDGDVAQFLASCDRLRASAPRILYPGHGDPVRDPAARIDWLTAHRRGRERQVLEALRPGPASAAMLARRIYDDIEPGLLPAATRNVLAHLIDLLQRDEVRALDPLSAETRFRLR